MIEFKVTPVPKPRMTRSDSWKKRPSVLRYWAFKDELVKQASDKQFELGDSYGVTFFIPMTEGWSDKKKRELFGKPHQQKPDLDNLLKSINDCLKKSDQTIHMIEASKVWWDEGKIVFYNLRKV